MPLTEPQPRPPRAPRVLAVPIEPVSWPAARGLAYSASLGVIDGLHACGATCTVLPAAPEFWGASPRNWVHHARRLFAGHTWDQAWVWVDDPPHDHAWLEWLASVAPVRVGIVTTSVEFSTDDCLRDPRLLALQSIVDDQLRFMTHVVCADEFDAPRFVQRLGLPSLWLPPSASPVAWRTTGRDPSVEAVALPDEPMSESAMSLLRQVQALLPQTPFVRVDVDDDALRLDAINELTSGLRVSGAASSALLDRQVRALRAWRREHVTRGLDLVGRCRAAVFLPTPHRSLSARVPEVIAAGVVALVPDWPARPRSRSLFAGSGLATSYDDTDAAGLAARLQALLADPEGAARQALAAGEALRERHRTDQRVRELLEWIDTGRQPTWIAATEGDRSTQSSSDTSRPQLPRTSQPRPRPEPERQGRRDLAEAYRLARDLVSALRCTHVVDLGGRDPDSFVRAASGLAATVICDEATARAYQARTPAIAWRAVESWSGVASLPRFEDALVACVEGFEHADDPRALATVIATLLDSAQAALIVTADREALWGAHHPGPPPALDVRQWWRADELFGLLADAGVDVVHRSRLAVGGRPEPTHVALVATRRARRQVNGRTWPESPPACSTTTPRVAHEPPATIGCRPASAHRRRSWPRRPPPVMTAASGRCWQTARG